jgi:hypothetical protein
MSIQEMLDEISDLTSEKEGIPSEFAALLSKVLKAAQEMRFAIMEFNEADGSDDINHKPSVQEANWSMGKAALAWDELTKLEDEI